MKKTIAFVAIAGLCAAAFMYRPEAPGTYTLALTLITGDEYAVEYGMTEKACRAKLVELFGEGAVKGAECINEG